MSKRPLSMFAHFLGEFDGEWDGEVVEAADVALNDAYNLGHQHGGAAAYQRALSDALEVANQNGFSAAQVRAGLRALQQKGSGDAK